MDRKRNLDMKELKDYIKTISDFPKKGIEFRDITSALEDKDGLQLVINSMEKLLDGVEFDKVVSPDARGFMLGMPIAYNKGVAFVPARKKGKLPRETINYSYDLEYGTDTLEIVKESIKPGDRVVIIDDLIATGGTIKSIVSMVSSLGGTVVLIACLIELPELGARKLFKDIPVKCCITYEGE